MLLSSKAFIGGRGWGLGSPEDRQQEGCESGGVGRELRRIGSRRDVSGGVGSPEG